jgi:hypothetical protein
MGEKEDGHGAKGMAQNSKDFDPHKYLAEARKAMKAICKARYEAFGCAGMAAKIKPISLETLASRYKKGEQKARKFPANTRQPRIVAERRLLANKRPFGI